MNPTQLLTHSFTLDEILTLCLHEVLRLNGVADPVAYTKATSVQHTGFLRHDINIMSVAVALPIASSKLELVPEPTK